MNIPGAVIQVLDVNLAQTFTPSVLLVTDRAAAKVRALIEDEGNPRLKLRVFVTGGGCSDFQYGFSFEETVEDDDTVVEKEGVGVVVDALSYPYLAGSEIGTPTLPLRAGAAPPFQSERGRLRPR